MENIHMQDPHSVPSNHEKSKFILNTSLIARIGIAALLATGFIALFLYLWETTQVKRVTIVAGDEIRTLETKAATVEQLLSDEQIAYAEHDKISAALDDVLATGDRIVIQYAKPVIVTADGKTQSIYTTSRTVGETLQQLDLTLGEEDRVTPALDTEITENGEIRIVRVQTVVEEFTETIPYETVKKNDNTILKGKEITVQEGREGVLVKKIRKVIEDGIVISEEMVDEAIDTPSVNKIVAVGMKNPVVALSASSPNVETVSKSGVTFGVKRVLKNVVMTAYSADFASTGKTEEHPQYGMTYSGTKVQEGRTIAVDPKVIPLGWWVYIEDVGFRRAEDIGGAVKGNKIDIYFDNEDYAKKFGTKKGGTVYIIGPKKPEAK